MRFYADSYKIDTRRSCHLELSDVELDTPPSSNDSDVYRVPLIWDLVVY